MEGTAGIDWTVATLRGRLGASGLAADEAALLDEAWSRCSPVRGTAARTVARRAGQSWTAFHEELVSAATRSAIDSGRGDLLMFHAAALADPDTGAAIALVAASGTGKTTATRTLGRRFGYLTDETVAVDVNRVLVPFPKPLSVLPESGERPKTQLSPDRLGLLPAPAAPRLAAVALLDRDRDGSLSKASAEAVTLGEALEWLSPQISSLAALDRGLVRLCRTLDDCGGVLRLRYSEAAQLLPVVRDILGGGGPAGAVGGWSPLEPGNDGGAEAPCPGMFRRAAADDAVLLDDGSVVVLRGGLLTILGGLGPVLWESSAGWTSREALTAVAVDSFGDHPDASALLEASLAALRSRGILEGS